MKIERKVKGIIAKPYIATMQEKELSVTIRADNLGDTLTLYDGETMLTIKLEDIDDLIRVNRATLIRCKKQPQEYPKENTDAQARTYKVIRVN